MRANVSDDDDDDDSDGDEEEKVWVRTARGCAEKARTPLWMWAKIRAASFLMFLAPGGPSTGPGDRKKTTQDGKPVPGKGSGLPETAC